MCECGWCGVTLTRRLPQSSLKGYSIHTSDGTKNHNNLHNHFWDIFIDNYIDENKINNGVEHYLYESGTMGPSPKDVVVDRWVGTWIPPSSVFGSFDVEEWSTHLHNIHYINDFVEVSLNKEIEYSRVSISQHSQDQIMWTNLDTWRVFLHHSTVLFSDLSRSYIGKKLDRPCHFSIWSVHQFQSLTDDIIGNQLWSWGEDKYCDVILWGTFVVII